MTSNDKDNDTADSKTAKKKTINLREIIVFLYF